MRRSGPQYAAFLRGINMIGRRTVKMAELRRIFESLNLSDVTTILASGNVVFRSKHSTVSALAQSLGRRLAVELGYPVGVIVWSLDELEALAASNPFQGIGIPPSPRTKLLTTLLSNPPTGAFRAPYTSPEQDFTVLRITDRAVFSVVTLAEGKRSSGVMSFLERQFGTEQTTRNWTTILKVLQARREQS